MELYLNLKNMKALANQRKRRQSMKSIINKKIFKEKILKKAKVKK